MKGEKCAKNADESVKLRKTRPIFAGEGSRLLLLTGEETAVAPREPEAYGGIQQIGAYYYAARLGSAYIDKIDRSGRRVEAIATVRSYGRLAYDEDRGILYATTRSAPTTLLTLDTDCAETGRILLEEPLTAMPPVTNIHADSTTGLLCTVGDSGIHTYNSFGEFTGTLRYQKRGARYLALCTTALHLFVAFEQGGEARVAQYSRAGAALGVVSLGRNVGVVALQAPTAERGARVNCFLTREGRYLACASVEVRAGRV